MTRAGMRILFVTSNRIGDAVLSTGLLDHLIRSHPDARFTVACGPDAAGLFTHMPQLDRLIPFEKRRRFLQAGQWLMAAHEIRDRHTSSWYVAQVAAIESLAHEEVPFVECPTCGKDVNLRPTARFKDFLERYAPGAGTRSQNDTLYAVRSGLVHGTALLHHDSPFGFSLLPFATGEREGMDRLSSGISVAMVNWLRVQASGDRGS